MISSWYLTTHPLTVRYEPSVTYRESHSSSCKIPVSPNSGAILPYIFSYVVVIYPWSVEVKHSCLFPDKLTLCIGHSNYKCGAMVLYCSFMYWCQLLLFLYLKCQYFSKRNWVLVRFLFLEGGREGGRERERVIFSLLKFSSVRKFEYGSASSTESPRYVVSTFYVLSWWHDNWCAVVFWYDLIAVWLPLSLTLMFCGIMPVPSTFTYAITNQAR